MLVIKVFDLVTGGERSRSRLTRREAEEITATAAVVEQELMRVEERLRRGEGSRCGEGGGEFSMMIKSGTKIEM